MRVRCLPLVLLVLLAACAPRPDDDAPGADPSRFLVDDDGGAVILHGVNLDSRAKSSPDHQPDLVEEDLELLAGRWGFDFSRHLIFWSAVEPEPGVYDEAYLDAVEARLDLYARHGVHAILDMHQDVYAQPFCCDGAPTWAIHADWEGYAPRSLWSANYFSPEVETAWEAFWSFEGEHRMLQEHYAAAWAHVAERFADHPAVVGYDVMNEPFPGTVFDMTELLTGVSQEPGGPLDAWDHEVFAPFYQRVIDAVRAVDADTPVWFEPRYGSPGNGARSFLEGLVDPRPGSPRLVHAPHLYSFRYELEQAYAGDDTTIPVFEARRAEEQLANGTPFVIGEWGLDHGYPDADRFTRELVEMADRQMVGWAYWSWDPGSSWAMFDRDPTPGAAEPWIEHDWIDDVVRPYPQRVAGEPTGWSFDVDARRFELAFDGRPGAGGDTRVFVPERWYPDGFDVAVDGTTSAWTWDEARRLVRVTTSDPDGSYLVAITPRSGPPG